MNAKTEKALEGSIRKWERIYRSKGVDRSAENCPLCHIFGDCKGCPVSKRTGLGHCFGSPYEKWNLHHFKKHYSEIKRYIYKKIYCEECKRLAKAELDFLKSLRPKKRVRKNLKK